MRDKRKKKENKRYYINIVRDDEIVTQWATQDEIDKLKAEGNEIIVAEDLANENIEGIADEITDNVAEAGDTNE